MNAIDWAEEPEATCPAILMDPYSGTELQWMACNRLYRLALARDDLEKAASAHRRGSRKAWLRKATSFDGWGLA